MPRRGRGRRSSGRRDRVRDAHHRDERQAHDAQRPRDRRSKRADLATKTPIGGASASPGNTHCGWFATRAGNASIRRDRDEDRDRHLDAGLLARDAAPRRTDLVPDGLDGGIDQPFQSLQQSGELVTGLARRSGVVGRHAREVCRFPARQPRTGSFRGCPLARTRSPRCRPRRRTRLRVVGRRDDVAGLGGADDRSRFVGPRRRSPAERHGRGPQDRAVAAVRIRADRRVRTAVASTRTRS